MSTSDPESKTIIPAAEMTGRFNAATAYAVERVVAIEVGFESARPGNIATGSVVTIAGARFIVTAAHVVLDGNGRPRPLRVMVPPRDADRRIQNGSPGRPTKFELTAEDVRWWSEELDVAVVVSPPQLAIPSYPGQAGIEMSQKAAAQWRNHEARDAYPSVVVTGFPAFARDSGPTHLDLLAVSHAGFVTSFNPERRRFGLEIGCTELRDESYPVDKVEQFQHQLDTQDEPLGGLSGGPVTLLLASGHYLIGIFCQGRQTLSLGFAAPWHVVHEQFVEHLALPVAKAQLSPKPE